MPSVTLALTLLQSDGVEHPLLATPPPDAAVSPCLPVRVFLQTKARPSSSFLQLTRACHAACRCYPAVTDRLYPAAPLLHCV